MADPAGIAAFITARLDEEEAIARAAIDGNETGAWRSDHDTVEDVGTGYVIASQTDDYWLDPGQARHIARQNPAVTLARVKALRGMVAFYEHVCHGDGYMGEAPWVAEQMLCCAAMAYRLRPDGTVHPDWREEWPA